MIREGSKQAWVTLASEDGTALQAIVMAKSLKKVCTTRKICIVITDDVSPEMKCLLLQAFHSIVTVSKKELERYRFHDQDLNSIVKLWCWTLKQFTHCVFMDPNYLVTNNIDEVFQYGQLSALESLLKAWEVEHRMDSSLLVLEPDLEIFEALLKAAGSLNVNDAMNSIFENWKALDNKFRLSMSREEATDVGTRSLEWMKLYRDYVLPLFQAQRGTGIRNYILDIQEKLNLQALNHDDELKENIEDYEGTIAVIGMSCRFPGANNADEYWKLLSEGREAIRRFPIDRPFFGIPESQEMQAGFLNCPIENFDAKFFGISPREALLVDPQQRLLLEVTWESLEHAGINPQTLRDTDTGVYVGMWQQDYERIIVESKKSGSGSKEETSGILHMFLGNKYSATASRTSYCLGLNGPAIAVESGCSSSLNGLHLACESLQSGETSLALVSGVNLILLPFNPFSGRAPEEESVVLSKDYKCKTFDESANGFVRAEACAVVVLKRFEDAYRDGDNILAIVKGTAVNNDGTGTSFGTPNEKAQEKVFRAALSRANVKAADVSYLEAHGTGTAVGDPIEMYAVGQAYSENRVDPLLVGSVKTNIGHCEAAAGMASLIKVILCMKHAAIPPHLNLKTLNHNIDLSRIPAIIPVELTPWKSTKKIAAISSFSMSATNAHAILQEPPKLREHLDTKSEPRNEIFTISAKSEQALTELSKSYINFLQNNSNSCLIDIAYTANTGRAHLQHRMAIVASGSSQLLSRLQNGEYIQGKAPKLKGKLGFIFTGQGSQYIGMTNGLSDDFPAFRNALNTCNQLFEVQLGQNLHEVLFKNDILLSQTVYCQPALFCVEYCLVQLWNFYGIKPDYVLGHSVGEFGAAVCAGVLTLEDAMKLVITRSKLVNELPGGSMTAIRASEVRVKQLIKSFTEGSPRNPWVDVAAVNSPEEVVVSGRQATIKEFETFCVNNGVQFIGIPATHAFHSRDMEPVLESFGQTTESLAVSTPNCIYISGTLVKAMYKIDFTSHYWQRHLRDSVRYADAIQLVWTECKTLLEIGPQPILLGLAMATIGDSTNAGTYIPSLRKQDLACTSVYTAMSKLYVTGTDFDWRAVYGIRQKRVDLPFYPFEKQKFWYPNEFCVKAETSPLLHPLLGRQFPSPLSDLVFCQTYTLKELDYIEDHKVAGFVIIPGAALLEVFMAAGREVIQGGSQNRFPITIENLVVEAALPLEKSCQVQILASLNAQNPEENTLNYKLSLSRKMENQFDKWKRHAVATFTPSATLAASETLDLDQVKSRLNHTESLENDYKKLADIGIQFGPKFQSVCSYWNGPAELLTKIELPVQNEDYICHPIVLDAMIQTSALREYLTTATGDQETTNKFVYLPVSIRKFTWLSRVPTQILFAHCTGKTGDVTLYTSKGEPLGIMEGLEHIRTTVSSVARAIRADSLEVPDFMCDRWRSVLGKTNLRVDVRKIIAPCIDSPNVATNKDVCRESTREVAPEALVLVNDSVFTSFLMTIQEADWPWPAIGDLLLAESWESRLPTTLNKGLIVIYLAELERRGYLDKHMAIRALPSILECKSTLAAIMAHARAAGERMSADIKFMERFSACFLLVLQGKMTATNFLYAEHTPEDGVHDFYTNSLIYSHQNVLMRAFLADMFANFHGMRAKDGVLRVLEIGAGSGSTTRECLECLQELKIPFQYTFTDISPLLLNEAKKKFVNSPEVTFRLMNIEEDPLSQGFSPAEFDVIIGAQVVHATESLAKTLENLKQVLRLNGTLILGEGFIPQAFHLFIFGLTDGWWRFNDFRLQRNLTALATEDEWAEILFDAGFNNIASTPGLFLGALAAQYMEVKSVYNENRSHKPKWLIFNDASQLCPAIEDNLKSNFRSVEIVETNENWREDPDSYLNSSVKNDTQLEGIIFFCTEFREKDIVRAQERITTPLLNFLKRYDDFTLIWKRRPKIVLITRGVYNIGDSGPGNPNGATAWAMMKVFRNESQNFHMSLIDLSQNASQYEVEQVVSQLWAIDGEYFLAFRENQTYVLRFATIDQAKIPMQLPATDRFKFQNPESGAFTEIEVCPRSRPDVPKDSLEIEVRACALNFRDIFMVLKPEGFTLPDDKSLGTLDSVGLDVSGVVVAVGSNVTKFKFGDEVFGMTNEGALGSHTVVMENSLLKIPDYMTFVEACTIPCAYGTAHVGLVEVAKMTSADRVLIHVATGGVGLASIQVATRIGAQIFATAGSERKRAYLRNLGIKHVYHSRNTSYGEGIQRDTNGLGVTVVLNSLTGPNFKETTLKICSPEARFVEIAKINIWKPEEVKALRPDVKYTIVDLSTKDALGKFKEEGGENEVLMNKVEQYVRNKVVTGLPSVVFQLSQVREAFYYFQKAQHIGKVVVQIPRYLPSDNGKFEHKHFIFNEKSCYLITGGLGGLGIEVTKWMRTVGAKTVVLLGRGSPTQNVQRRIDQWNRDGSNIIVMQGDVGQLNGCKAILKHIQELGLPQLRGIMHAAGVLADNFMINQSEADMQKVLAPKVYGSWYLHSLTLNYPLEFFIMFSSVSGGVGCPMQCNHSAANRFLDALTHYRVSMGLPGSSINWGGWSEIGAASQLGFSSEMLMGLRMFTLAQGIAALNAIMCSRQIQTTVGEWSDWNVVKKVFSQGRYWDEMKAEDLGHDKYGRFDYLVEEIRSAASQEERQDKLRLYIEAILKQTLNLPDSEVLDIDQNFSEMGVDSLMGMEMKNRFQAVIGNRTLSVSSVQENRTIRSLSAHLATLMENERLEPRPVEELLQEDEILPFDVTPSRIFAPNPSEIHKVLLTGVTGHLGIHCLFELLHSASCLTVYCLIRGKSDENAELRLQKACDKYKMTIRRSDRVVALAGDVSKENLGLKEEIYIKMSKEVDGVLHCAVKNNQLDGYSDGSRYDMRTHNVLGLVHILRFTSFNKTKHLFHMSSLFAATKLSASKQIEEYFPEERDTFPAMEWGYHLSKFICEKLLNQALKRGIPLKVIRLPILFGNSKTGHMPVDNDHAWASILASIRTRMIAKETLNGIPIIAVDEAAKVIINIFLSDDAEEGMYNLTVNSTLNEEIVQEGLAELGVVCEFVTFKEWVEAVAEGQDMTGMAPFTSLYMDANGESRISHVYGLMDLKNLDVSYFTDKMIRNYPDIVNTVTPAQTIVRRQLLAHLTGATLANSG